MPQPTAIAFMLGDNTPAVLDELRAAVLCWSEQAGDKPLPLHRFLGMGGPRATRTALRDELLVEVVALLDGGTQWSQCKQLADAARAFYARRWEVWRKHGIPSGASAVDVLFYRVLDMGGRLPKTQHGWRDILLKQNASAA